jgi:hypothetical protein
MQTREKSKPLSPPPYFSKLPVKCCCGIAPESAILARVAGRIAAVSGIASDHSAAVVTGILSGIVEADSVGRRGYGEQQGEK